LEPTNAAAGDRRRRVDAGARGECPERLARLRLERVHYRVAPAEHHLAIGDRRRRVERELTGFRRVFPEQLLLCRSSAITSLLKDLLTDDENDPARGASSRFDRWSGLAISVV
jgi:hypothetical protein